MKKNLFTVCLLFLAFIGVEASDPIPYEIPRTQVIPIKNTATGGQYELYIKLPEAYSESNETEYPVIYFTDAVWHIEMLSGSTSHLMEDVILVGISWQKDINEELKKEIGAHLSRFRDYTINESSNSEIQAKYQLGRASKHLDFIRNDVIKYIENNYHIDPDNRTYFGYSAGGLFGACILMKEPDTFRNYILGSPSIQSDMPTLSELDSKNAKNPGSSNINIFVSHGALEEELGEHIEEFITMLNNRNDESLSLQHVVVEGSHQTAFPITAVRSVAWLSNLTKAKE